MKRTKELNFKRMFSLVINLLIVFFAAQGFVLCYFHWKWRLFTFYTEFSNFFAIVTSSIIYFLQIKNIRKNKPLPYWAKLIKYFSTCCLSLTFLVVLFILAPGSGKGGFQSMFIEGSSLYFHLINPLLAIISFVFFEREPDLQLTAPQLALIPTVFYAVVIYPLIIIEKVTPPYPFLDVYQQPIYMTCLWFLILLGACFLVNFGLYMISTNNLTQKTKRR